MNIEFSVKTGKTLALLTEACGEYTMKQSSVLNGRAGSRKGEKMCRMTQEVGSQKRKRQIKMWTGYEDWVWD
jgi:hypothetical protein